MASGTSEENGKRRQSYKEPNRLKNGERTSSKEKSAKRKAQREKYKKKKPREKIVSALVNAVRLIYNERQYKGERNYFALKRTEGGT